MQYLHIEENTEELKPYAHKGIEATLFTVFQALGMTATVRPIIDDRTFEGWTEYRRERLRDKNGYNDDVRDFENESITRVASKFHGFKGNDERVGERGDPEEVSISLPVPCKERF